MSRLDSEGRVILDPDPTPGERALAVVDCGLCDDDGYRGTVVCDHVDHTGAAQRGMAKVRQILTQKPRRDTDTPNGENVSQEDAQTAGKGIAE